MSKIPCSVEILTRNSGKTLERCLESVKDFAEIIVLDGNSTDNTLEIARKYGAKIYKQYETDEPEVRIKDYAEVRNKGLRLASYDWFMYIDSDEYLSREAVEEIRGVIENPNSSLHVFWQPRKYVLEEKIIDCATTYPNQQIRFFHKDFVDKFIKQVHEKIKVKPGVIIGTLKNFEYVPEGNLGELKMRWERYMMQELEAVKNAPRVKLLKYVFRHAGLFIFYTHRYLHNLLFCSGNKMPFSYEWTRHSYPLKIIKYLIKEIVR